MNLPLDYPNCFVCGADNSRGLRLSFSYDQETRLVESRFSLHEDFNGWPGVAHGGIVASILDETAYYAIAQHGQQWAGGLTVNINLDYKAPTPLCQPLLAQAWVEKSRRNLVYCQTRLYREKDMKLLAQAVVSYLMKKTSATI